MWAYVLAIAVLAWRNISMWTMATPLQSISAPSPINSLYVLLFGIQPLLASGQSTGRDIVVLTDNDRYLGLMLKNGYAEKLDKSAIPNMKNLVDVQKHPSFDPNRDYTLPWQSGMTGLAYNDKLTDPVLSIDDLLENPKLKG